MTPHLDELQFKSDACENHDFITNESLKMLST